MGCSKTELKPIRIVSYGIGVIGLRLASHILSKKGLEIVGAIDIDPNKVGRDVGELLGGKKLGVVIKDDAVEVISTTKPDIVVHTTLSYLRDTYDQFIQILNHGVNVVSTCEELSYPQATEEGLAYAEKLDKLAINKGATILGAGINPGFIMDSLPIMLTGICTEVETVYITRQMNAATRRVPFQRKIGAGLTVDEFKKKIDNHEITGHVGLEQSIRMISDALGWILDDIRIDSVEPVVLNCGVASDAIEVPKGYNAGSKQKAYGVRDGDNDITLDFRAYIGALEEYDSIVIDGVPPINQRISPCVHGDYGTIAIVVNMIPQVINAEPGLKTMVELPIPHMTSGHMSYYLKK